ncbi:unnamed protein product [Alopecurus aequalis]
MEEVAEVVGVDQPRLISDISGKSSSDLDKQPGCGCKRALNQRHQSTNNGKEVNTQDQGKDANASGSKKLKRYKGFTIDINKVPQHDESDHEIPLATRGKRAAPHQEISLDNKKKELEIDAKRLKLEKQRLKWASESLRYDMELKKMRLENDRMKVENKQLWVKIKRRALELGVKL